MVAVMRAVFSSNPIIFEPNSPPIPQACLTNIMTFFSPHHFWNQLNHRSLIIQEKMKRFLQTACLSNSLPMMKPCFKRFLCVITAHRNHTLLRHSHSLSTKIEPSIIFTNAITVYSKKKKKKKKKEEQEQIRNKKCTHVIFRLISLGENRWFFWFKKKKNDLWK